MSTTNTVYRGRVGAAMRPFAIPRPTRRTPRISIGCTGGPFHDLVISFAASGRSRTLTFRVGALVGMYDFGRWVPA